MHKELEARFADLERRRAALTRRVLSLSPDAQAKKPDPKAFSPAQVLMHLAISEHKDVLLLKKNPPTSLKGKSPKVTAIFRVTVAKLENPTQPLPTFPGMVPSEPVDVQQAAGAWQNAREQLGGFLEQVELPSSPFIKMGFLLGTPSAADYLSLLEAHTKYHEERFPTA